MLEYLFGNQHIEKILFFLLKERKCYGKQLSDHFCTSVFGIQTTLKKLEKAGVLVSYRAGKTRFYEFNPRYPFLPELKNFAQKAYSFLPDAHKKKWYEHIERKRPRRTGKPL